MRYYAGLDVSLAETSVCVVDEEGKILREAKVASEPEALATWLGALGLPFNLAPGPRPARFPRRGELGHHCAKLAPQLEPLLQQEGNEVARKDPIGPAFYVPLGVAEKIADGVFYLAGTLSVLVLLVDKMTQPFAYEILQATFALSVVAIFAIGIVIRVYFAARAHATRVADFVSNAFRVPLITNPSKGYYNTPNGDAYVRMGASLLENTLFTKSILAHMLTFERSRAGLYLCIWIWALSYRATNLELVAIAAQVLFSEQLLSRWIRMEWLRLRTERLYDDVYALFQSTADTATVQFRARVIDALIRYETSKAQAGVSLSSRVFNRLNSDLSSTWLTVTRQLGLTLPAASGADAVP